MKTKTSKVISFFPKPTRIVDKTQEEIMAERRRIRKEKLDKLLKRD